MQLNEFFLWRTINQKKYLKTGNCVSRSTVVDKKTNSFWSWILIATLVIQVASLYFSEYGLGQLDPTQTEDGGYDVAVTVIFALFLFTAVLLCYFLL